MAEHESPKQKYLYVLGTEHAEKFLKGGRALSSVLTRNEKLGDVHREVWEPVPHRARLLFAKKGNGGDTGCF